jgi:hypothetical protein
MYLTVFLSQKFIVLAFPMKKLLLACALLCQAHSFLFAQKDSTQQLVPVESLVSKVKKDTSKFVSEIPVDTSKVDTVYIDNPLNLIKVGADLSSAYGMGFIAYERVVAFMGSLQIKMEILGTYNPFQNVSYIKETYANTNSIVGIGLVPEGRYYGSEKYAPKGLFVGMYIPFKLGSASVPQHIDYNGFTYSLSSDHLTYSLIGVGFDCGYQFIHKKKWSIEALVGFSMAKGSFSEGYYTHTFTVDGVTFDGKIPLKDGSVGNGFYPRAEISFGWAIGK